MNLEEMFSKSMYEEPFSSYEEYTNYLFACVDSQLSKYIENLKSIFATGDGNYKNVLYPDIEIAHRLTEKHLADFSLNRMKETATQDVAPEMDAELKSLFAEFAVSESGEAAAMPVGEMLDYVRYRAQITDSSRINMPFFKLAERQNFGNFTLFCFASAVLSSTQTNYAAIFQVVNQNSAYSCPTIESAGRVFYGKDFSMSMAYAEMSAALEQLAPIIDMKVNPAVPFSTLISPDKRMIDFLFGSEPMRTDPSYNRFFRVLTDEKKLDPFIANKDILGSLNISFEDETRIFNLYGDEGAGKRFTTKHFCTSNNLGCISLDCAKLFSYDFSFVSTAIWAICRECILANAACALTNLSYREEEKEKFFGYMDLALGRLREKTF